ncbi:MAG: mandelate racemase/muconate lactonizing enzyme family protein [Thermoguttaceae bacterium]|nr:mandelate racemase/muconate lactonizing enzyme family protein [Thermoguttaceae bacterium]
MMISRRTFTGALLGAAACSFGSGVIASPAIVSGRKPTDITIKSAQACEESFPLRTQLKFGGLAGGTALSVLTTTVEVESRDGRRASGRGVMTIGNRWGWPSRVIPGQKTNQAMIATGKRMATCAAETGSCGHPLELCRELATHYADAATAVVTDMKLPESMPRLAQLVCASPLEAAVFDAYGKLLGQNVFNLLGKEFVNSDLSDYLNKDFSGEYLDQYTSRAPQKRMPLYHLIGGADALTQSDIPKRLNDGWPETLGEWIVADGLTHMKIKLLGNNLEKDVRRVVDIEKVVAPVQHKRKVNQWFYSVDFNEQCPDEQYVLDWLKQVATQSPNAFKSIQYIEQPTNRDLTALPRITMFRAAKVRPVVIDESLVDFQSLLMSRREGYSGVALKACKGLAEALLMGAAAQKYHCFLCVQDLTCPGESFLLSASLAAHIPTVQAVEGNARQFCPQANKPCEKRFPGLFDISNGTVETGVLSGPGIGF